MQSRLLLAAAAAVALQTGLHAAPARADDGLQTRETLFDDSAFDTGYAAFAVKAGRVMGKGAVMVGGQGGFDANRYLSLGAGVYGLTTKIKPDLDEAGDVNFHYFGVLAESKVYTYQFVTATLGVLVGGGQVSYKTPLDETTGVAGSTVTREGDEKQWRHSGTRVFEPSAGVLVHLNHHADFGLSAGKRFVSGIGLDGVSDGGFSGGVLTLLLRGEF
jgi:hypothetical protein